MLTRWAGPTGIKAGIVAGIIVNLFLWLLTPISWLWWNLTGLLATVLTSSIASRYETAHARQILLGADEPGRLNWKFIYVIVGIYFVVIIGIAHVIEVSL